MAHTARGYCWTRDDDMVDNGYGREVKPVINTPTLPSKPSFDYELRDGRVNARNGYNTQCDFIMGLWRDRIDYMRAVEFACQWLARFNQLSGIEEACR